MKQISHDRICPDNSLDVSEWLTERHNEQEIYSLCVYYDRFGFGMSLEQVQQAVAKLDAVRTRGEPSETSGEIQIDRSGMEDGYIMIAFRPAPNHPGRYFDFPESAARDLLARFQERLTRAAHDGYNGVSAKGEQT